MNKQAYKNYQVKRIKKTEIVLINKIIFLMKIQKLEILMISNNKNRGEIKNNN